MALSYIPATENPLFSIAELTNQTIYQFAYPIFYNVSSHVNLSILPDNFASLTFNSTDYLIEFALPLASIILNEDAVRIPVNCIYPLSGSYDTLSRILFYVLMIFSLLCQRYKEISIAALVTAMTYAAVSAVHALALVTLFKYGVALEDFRDPFSSQQSGDPDLFGLFPILAVSGIMLTPILMWSTTVRDHHGQSVILSWGILILSALGAVVGTLLRSGEQAAYDILTSFALCTNTSPSCRSFADNFTSGLLPRDVYDNCDCMDFCSTYSPTSPMRRGANMVAYSTYDPDFFFSPVFGDLTVIGIPVLVFVFVSGVFGLLSSQWSQDDVRNGIFTFINGNRFTFLNGRSKKRAAQLSCAKYIAASVFFTGVFVAVLAPLVFVFSVVTFELLLVDFPQSEQSDAVGAWGTCVGAALVLLATIFAAYQGRCVDYIRSIFGFPRHRKLEIKLTPKPQRASFVELCSKPIYKVKAAKHNFMEWWKDPERVYAERQHQKEQEREIKAALEEEKTRHKMELSRLHHRVREIRSGGHRTQIPVANPTNSTEINIDENRNVNENKPFFYDGMQAYPSSSSKNQTFSPISSRSFLHSRGNSDIEFEILGRDL